MIAQNEIIVQVELAKKKTKHRTGRILVQIK